MARKSGRSILRRTRPWWPREWYMARRCCMPGRCSSPPATSKRSRISVRRSSCVLASEEDSIMRWIAFVMLALMVGADAMAAEGITVDKEKKTVTVAGKVAPRKLPNLDQIYPIEVIATWPLEKKGQKAHE